MIVAKLDVVRTHSTDAIPAASDLICALLGIKNGRQAWNAVKKRNPELLTHIKTERKRGGAVDFITASGFGILVADIRSNKAQGQAALTKLRTAANEIATRFWNADPTLATDLIERIDDPAHLEHIAQCAQSKLTQRLLTDSINCKAAGGKASIYAIVNDQNNRAITGHSAKEIVANRSTAAKRVATRDLFSIEELVELQFVELQEQRAIKRLKGGTGNNHITRAQASVLELYSAFKK